MIVTRHIGRTCNNMFQIAASIGYARKYGYQWAADYGKGVGEPYSAIHEVFPNLPKHEFNGTRFHEHPNEFCRLHGMHKNECHFDYHPIPNLGPNVAMTGFFQSWKYFEGQDEEIKRVFALNIEPIKGGVSLHVRRGDYVNHAGSFPPIDTNYVQLAINAIEAKGIDVYHIHVFSDDIEWCESNLSQKCQVKKSMSHWYFHNGNELEDLTLMASCDHHIIANSTFSWWGAYLGHNQNKIVVSPSCERGSWFGMSAGVKRPVVDLLPPDWIQVKFR